MEKDKKRVKKESVHEHTKGVSLFIGKFVTYILALVIIYRVGEWFVVLVGVPLNSTSGFWVFIIFGMIAIGIVFHFIGKLFKEWKDNPKKMRKEALMFILVFLFLIVLLILTPDATNFNSNENRVRNIISDEYAVTRVSSLNIGDRTTAMVGMISLGNREDQVWEGLTGLKIVYTNATTYSITIIEETQKCVYDIDAELYNSRGFYLDDIIEAVELCF